MKKILSGNSLKVLAVASMTVDHVGAVLFPSQIWMRCVGRLAFVIYAFLIAEGYFHTHNVKKYMGRLGFLAIVSEIPFDLVFHHTFVYWGSQNVFFTLFLGLVGLYLMDRIKLRLQPQFWFCALIPVAAMCLAAGLLQCDYRYYGILVITLFYMARDYRWAAFGGIAVLYVYLLDSVLWHCRTDPHCPLQWEKGQWREAAPVDFLFLLSGSSFDYLWNLALCRVV